jgi:hypothetical protein
MKILLENWRKYLDEAPKAMAAIPGTDTQSGRQGSIDYFWDEGRENLEDEKDPTTGYPRFQKINRKDGGVWEGHQVVLFNDPTGRDTFYFLLDGETPVFYIATQPHEDGVITGNVRKATRKFRVTDFYKWLIDQRGVVYSDTMQSPGGQKIWARLAEDPEINVEEDGERLRATQK